MKVVFVGAILALTVFVVACSGSDSNAMTTISNSVTTPTRAVESMNMANVAADKVISSQTTIKSTEVVSGVTQVIQSGTTAKYSIGERLAKFDTPITAVGVTQEVIGELVFDSKGEISSDSLIKIDATSFKSDENKRDNWIRRNGGLGQEITFAVTEVKNLSWPLPTSGSATFVIIGDMTVSGTTVSTAWDTIADFSGDEIMGTAKTSISWDQFNLSKPKLSFIISVDDDIFLELNFTTSQ